MKNIFGAALVGAALVAGSASQAAVLSTTGSMSIIATPTSVGNNLPSSDAGILVFNEIQNLVVTATDAAALLPYLGVLTVGTRISSHMILLNQVAGNQRERFSGAATFDDAVLGLITTTAGLAATDAILGAMGTTYAAIGAARGLENGDIATYSGNTANVDLRITQPGDWMRVVTVSAVPVPAAGFLLIGALGGLAALRRRKALAA